MYQPKLNLKSVVLIGLMVSLSAISGDIHYGRSVLDPAFLTQPHERMKKGPTEGIANLFWSEQDTIQEEISEEIGELSLDLDFIEDDIDHESNFEYRFGINISPKREVFTVANGEVRPGGIPTEDLEAYYITADSLLARFNARTTFGDILSVGSNFNFSFEPAWASASELVKKTSIIRDYDLFHKYNKNPNVLDQMRSIPQNLSESKTKGLAGAVRKAFQAAFGIIHVGYSALEDIFREISDHVADDETLKLFFEDTYNSAEIKNRLFYIDDKKVLENLRYGEVLHIVQRIEGGLAQARLSIVNIFKGRASSVLTRDKTRIIERVPLDKCNNIVVVSDGFADVEECREVNVVFRYYVQMGLEHQEKIKPGVGALGINLGGYSFHNVIFKELEWVYRLDLATEDGQNAFNSIFNNFEMKWDDLQKIIAKNKELVEENRRLTQQNQPYNYTRTPGIQLVSYAWRGYNPSDESKKDKKFKKEAKYNGKRVTGNGRLGLIAYTRKHRDLQEMYEECQTVVANNPSLEELCSFNGVSRIYHKMRNEIQLDIDFDIKKWWRGFIKDISVSRDRDRSDIGIRVRAEGKTMDLNESASFHFYSDYGDESEEIKEYRRVRLEYVAMMLAVDQLPFYQNSAVAKDIYNRIQQLRDPARKLHLSDSIQSLNADIYMSGTYTKTILSRSEEEVKDAIVYMMTGHRMSWDDFMVSKRKECKRFEPLYNMDQFLKRFVVSTVGDGTLVGRCADTKRAAKDIFKTFSNLRLASVSKQIRGLIELYTNRSRAPYIAYLLMVLGQDHVKMLEEGHLAIRFRSEASDFDEANRYKDFSLPDIDTISSIASTIYIGRNPYWIREKGSSHLRDLTVYIDPDSTGSKRVYLEFNSDLSQSAAGLPLELTGHISKFRVIRADEKIKDFIVKQLTPLKIINGSKNVNKATLFKYVVDLGTADELGLKDKTEYVIQARLKEPELYTFEASKRLSEVREIGFKFRK